MSASRTLLFDVGNTRLKWGVSEAGNIRRTGSVTLEKLHDSGFATLTTRMPRNVDRVIASNVAGASFATKLSGIVGIHCNTDLHFAHCEKAAFGVTNSYRQPRRMGVDRWVAMIGAYAEFRGALCVVDAGTAVTIDAIDRDGQHLGGQIIPGLELMSDTLRRDTSEIPAKARQVKTPGEGVGMFANNTDGAVLNGSFNAIVGAIERAVSTLRSAAYRPKLVLTGGDASRILSRLDSRTIHRPHLVLQGLAVMVESET